MREAVVSKLPPDMPIIAVMDDTLIHKSGRKIKGAGWKRDPLRPKFRPNFIWALRFLQVSLIYPEAGFFSRGRAIPVDLTHAPTPPKPRHNATDEENEKYKQGCQENRISVRGYERIVALGELSRNGKYRTLRIGEQPASAVKQALRQYHVCSPLLFIYSSAIRITGKPPLIYFPTFRNTRIVHHHHRDPRAKPHKTSHFSPSRVVCTLCLVKSSSVAMMGKTTAPRCHSCAS